MTSVDRIRRYPTHKPERAVKRTLVACLFSLGSCSLLLICVIAVRARCDLELAITRLEERQRGLENELRERSVAEAQFVPAIRRLEARGTAVAEHLQELQSQMATAEMGPSARLVSSAELDEVVSAVNELVDVVDDLSGRMDAPLVTAAGVDSGLAADFDWDGDGDGDLFLRASPTAPQTSQIDSSSGTPSEPIDDGDEDTPDVISFHGSFLPNSLTPSEEVKGVSVDEGSPGSEDADGER